jgi:hypothetical protein
MENYEFENDTLPALSAQTLIFFWIELRAERVNVLTVKFEDKQASNRETTTETHRRYINTNIHTPKCCCPAVASSKVKHLVASV